MNRVTMISTKVILGSLVSWTNCMGLDLKATGPVSWSFSSGTHQVSLLELFTSEGCSSCPPSEAWLTQKKKDTQLWRDFVPVAYHVDYWDSLGWKDRWGSAQWSRLQEQYFREGRTSSVYTPGFFANGREWKGWFTHETLPINQIPAAGVLSISSNGDNPWNVLFTAKETQTALVAHLVLARSGVTTDVQAGENRGQRLRHDFVAVSKSSADLQRDPEGWKGVIDLPGFAKREGKEWSVACWIVERGQRTPLQATGGWITH